MAEKKECMGAGHTGTDIAVFRKGLAQEQSREHPGKIKKALLGSKKAVLFLQDAGALRPTIPASAGSGYTAVIKIEGAL